MGVVDEFFNALMFGSGSWLGLLIVIAIMLLITLNVKFASIVFIPFGAIMILFYLENTAQNSAFMWNSVIMLFNLILLIAIEVKRK